MNNHKKAVRLLTNALLTIMLLTVICAVFAVIGYVMFTHIESKTVLRVIFAVFEVLLLVTEAMFCIRMQAAYHNYKNLKKEYCLAPNKVKAGHTGRTRAEVYTDLVNIKVELISWLCIFLTCLYAIFDCFTWIIK